MKARDSRETIMSKGVIQDDEDELEVLRLAALESLRAKGLPPPIPTSVKHSVPIKPNTQVFQRHSANQNLIAIVPVEVPTVVKATPASSTESSHTPPSYLMASQKTSPRVIKTDLYHNSPTRARNENKLVLPQDRHLVNSCNKEEEKPKPSNKFSRFEDSDSEESEHDEIEISFTGSDSELEMEVEEVEIVVLEEESRVDESNTENDPKLLLGDQSPQNNSPAVDTVPPALPVARNQTKLDSHTSCRAEDAESLIQPRDSAKRAPSKRDSPGRQHSRRSPTTASSSSRSSPHPSSSNRKSTTPSSRTLAERFHRAEEKRSSGKSGRSGSADPSTLHPRRPGENVLKGTKDGRKSSDDRSGSHRKQSNRSSSMEKSTGDRKRASSGDRQRRPERCSPDLVKSPLLNETERERLESRKRKFENSDAIDPLKSASGKIRLKASESGVQQKVPQSRLKVENSANVKRTSSPSQKSNGREAVPLHREMATKVRETEESKDHKANKKSKKSKERKLKSKDKSRSSPAPKEEVREPPRISIKTPDVVSANHQDAQVDLRAELQRRRIHRADEEEPARHVRTTTPERNESRRILVLKSPPSARPPSAEPEAANAGLLKQRLDGGVRFAKVAAVIPEQAAANGPPKAAVKRNVAVNGSHSSLPSAKAKVQVQDQGRDTVALEDRIRQIRAKNDEIRRRQLEIEADRLKYA